MGRDLNAMIRNALEHSTYDEFQPLAVEVAFFAAELAFAKEQKLAEENHGTRDVSEVVLPEDRARLARRPFLDRGVYESSIFTGLLRRWLEKWA